MRDSLDTHRVENQAESLPAMNLFETNQPLLEVFDRFGHSEDRAALSSFGAVCGSDHTFELGALANRYPPSLETFDRFGRRVDRARFHPSYHELMDLGVGGGVHSSAWNGDAGHIGHAIREYCLAQAEQGVCCPLTMTYAAAPVLAAHPELGNHWFKGAISNTYDPRVLPPANKEGLTFGMAMTEKQGGSDVQANTTWAEPISGARESGAAYRLTGHKWFCSAPNSDAFLTLAQTLNGLSCFLVPRVLDDGTENAFEIQRLKDKLGNRSNASSEVEYRGTIALLVGAEGRGVPTIIEMVHHTRLDTTLAPAALMRRSLLEAIHHCRHRRAFGSRLVEKPLMKAVLCDLAIESEAATWLFARLAHAFDRAGEDEHNAAFARVAVALGKYRVNKRVSEFVYEAMECIGGNGYVEENPLPRLYREAPLNSIWEGSGNVICLDILRAFSKQPHTLEALRSELGETSGVHRLLDDAVGSVERLMGKPSEDLEPHAREIASLLSRALQASLLWRFAPHSVAEAFTETRLAGGRTEYGNIPSGLDTDAIIERALPGG
ncbi:MAG: acyl-CoA dehydrogenase family protein [Spirochaetales bacterium]